LEVAALLAGLPLSGFPVLRRLVRRWETALGVQSIVRAVSERQRGSGLNVGRTVADLLCEVGKQRSGILDFAELEYALEELWENQYLM
jgi:hypothetical protein